MKPIITFLLLFTCIGISSQNQISKKDINTYREFTDELYDRSVEKAIRLADSTYNIAIKENNKLLEILMLKILAVGAGKKGDFKTSNHFFLKEYNALTDLNVSYIKDSLLIQNLNIHGNNYLNFGKFTKGIQNFNKSLAIGKKNKDSILIGRTYNLLGNAYGKEELLDDAIFYYTECMKYDTSIEMRNFIDNNLGVIYTDRKEYKLAEKHLLEGLKTTDSNNFYDLSTSYYNLGLLYTKMGKYEKAHLIFLKAEKYGAKVDDKTFQLENKISLITSFTNIKKYKSAKRYIKICDSLANQIDSNDVKMSLYQQAYASSSQMNDYKIAFKNAEKYIAIHDSIFSIEKTKIAKDLKIKHESDLKETEILRQKELIKSQNIQNTSLLIGLGLIIICMVFIYFLYKKRAELANERMNTILEKQKAETYQSRIEGQNQERKRISKELHDGVLGRLFGTRINLGFLKFKDEENNKQFKLFLDGLKTIEKDIRDVSHQLSTDFNEYELNFTEKINQLVKETSLTGNFNYSVNISNTIEWSSLNGLVKINLYRILQEGLQNIIKHAQAKQVVLDFSVIQNQLVMKLTDKGVGFSTTENSNGIGTKNITSRVKDINGTIDITSKKGKGTTIHISVPYKPIS